MSEQSHCEPVQDSFVDNDSSVKEDDTTFNNGRWTDSEHRKFLEAIAVYGNKWDKVKEHILSRSTRQIRSHAQKFVMSLSKKKIEKETKNTNSSIEQLKTIDKAELESIIYNKFKGNSMKLFDLDMNMSNNYNRDSKKKVFMIEKFPRHRILKDMIKENGENSKEYIKGILEGKNEMLAKKRILDDVLNEEDEERTEKKIEELRKMSEVLQILNKSNNKKINNNNKSTSNNNIINRNNPPIPNNENKTTQPPPVSNQNQTTDNIFKLPPSLPEQTSKSLPYPQLANFNNVNKFNNSIQNYFTSISYNFYNNLLNGYPTNDPYRNQYILSYLSPYLSASNGNFYTASQYLQSQYNANYLSNPYYQPYMDSANKNNQGNQ